MSLLLFIAVASAVIVIPGPNVLVIVATSLEHGRRRGLQTVAGTSTAMLLQLFIAAVGTAWFVTALSNGFIWLKWAGAAYLFYLGVSNILATGGPLSNPLSASGSFWRGFMVSLTNPKTILFFTAFLPQFALADQPYIEQIIVLSLVFWMIAILFDSTYAILASVLARSGKIPQHATFWRRLSGSVYLVAAGVLALKGQV